MVDDQFPVLSLVYERSSSNIELKRCGWSTIKLKCSGIELKHHFLSISVCFGIGDLIGQECQCLPYAGFFLLIISLPHLSQIANSKTNVLSLLFPKDSCVIEQFDV